MARMSATRATKNAIVELILLAFADSKLKDLGLPAMRGVLRSDPKLAVLDGECDLASVWELLEAQPGFDPSAAVAPFCYLKTLEPRMNVTLRLPAKLGTLSEADIVRNAGGCKPDREEIERVLATEYKDISQVR